MNSKKEQLRLFAQTIPAQPGFYALDLCYPYPHHNKQEIDWDAPIVLQKEPVIAWFVEVERNQDDPVSYVTPICQNDLSDLFQGAILRPDGTVAIHGGDGWRTIEDYRATIEYHPRNLSTALAYRAEGIGPYVRD